MRDGSHRIFVTGSDKRGSPERSVRDRQRPSRASNTITSRGGGTFRRIVSVRAGRIGAPTVAETAVSGVVIAYSHR